LRKLNVKYEYNTQILDRRHATNQAKLVCAGGKLFHINYMYS